jgi:hypothetical protein
MTLNKDKPWLCFLGHFGPRMGNGQTPPSRMTLNTYRHFVPGYYLPVPPRQKPFAHPSA